MTSHIALLRGVNVGGHKLVAMADLRDLATGLGLAEVRTLLQSGNLIFQCAGRTPPQLEALLETAAAKRLALQTCFFVRTASEWAAVIAGNPFGAEAVRDPGHLVVMCLKRAPDGGAVRALQAAISGPERVRADGPHLYIHYPDGIGRSRLTNALIERVLGTRGTARNWNTVLKLGAAAGSDPASRRAAKADP